MTLALYQGVMAGKGLVPGPELEPSLAAERSPLDSLYREESEAQGDAVLHPDTCRHREQSSRPRSTWAPDQHAGLDTELREH